MSEPLNAGPKPTFLALIVSVVFLCLVICVAAIFCLGFIGSDDPCYNPHVVCRGF